MVDSVESFAHVKIYDNSNFLLVATTENKNTVKINDVSVECHLLLPLCLTNILWLDVIYRDSWFNITLSRTLESISSSEIGPKLLAFSWSLFLRIAQTSAIFQNIGTTPLVGEILMVEVNTGNNNHRRRALLISMQAVILCQFLNLCC